VRTNAHIEKNQNTQGKKKRGKKKGCLVKRPFDSVKEKHGESGGGKDLGAQKMEMRREPKRHSAVNRTTLNSEEPLEVKEKATLKRSG